MRSSLRRRGALIAAGGLLLATVPIALNGGVVHAGTAVTTNACLSNATATYSDINWTLGGTDSPDPATLGGGDVTLSGSTVEAAIPATLLIAGYNLGLLAVGSNNIPTSVWVSRQATNASTTSAAQIQSGSDVIQVDTFSVVLTTNITDPNGVPGTGDETATPLQVVETLPDMVVTPTGGAMQWRQADPGNLPLLPAGTAGAGPVQPNGSIYATASVAGGLVRANFDCFSGTTNIDPPGGTSGPTFTAAPPNVFETTTVTAPPTAPACNGESVSVGAGQSQTIDLTDNCSDVNGNIDPATYAVTALTPASPAGGTLTATATPGVYTYDAPAIDPGLVTFDFTVADTGGLVSNTATVTISVLANQCDATTGACELQQIIVQPVVGTTMTMDKAEGFVVMNPVVLDGSPQVSSGALKSVTVTNARGTAAGWDVTGYVTDIGAPGSPTITPLPGITISACSVEGSLTLQPDPDRLCIPGNNLAWGPSAQVTHDRIAGDVAHVDPGTAQATDAADWLAQLIAAGAVAPATATPPPTVPGVDGIGGLQETNLLCAAPVNQAGGTFQCDASLWLGVPASAGAGNYTGGIVLTLT